MARMARAWSWVHTLAASPNRTPFASRRASSSSVKGCTVTTGPKNSSCTISSSWRTPATTVGEWDHPGRAGIVPPVTTSAWFGSRLNKACTEFSWARMMDAGLLGRKSGRGFHDYR
ncbi:hypothetical protein Sgleb_03360 [Streptomyces glebosus]|uniref:3-hydroxyacyl-CoA dehydrogenase C-terminal domain-containing protein n=1 Tax=Streptomyces glebosus TaxID=249580 RepID=A0A640SLF4_9ACTN|nr:hypothetical protein Sgleb_03360 [Streptomyces glebosus]GHG72094.1 hypothetical protein GCM10010513_44630 [Streptomyces glebosus]